MKNVKRNGFAKVEFIACKDEILVLREAGYSLAMIHEKLSKSGKISMSYKHFCSYFQEKKPPVQPQAPVAVVKHFGVRAERPEKPSVAASTDAFVHDPSAKAVLDRLKPAGGKKED